MKLIKIGPWYGVQSDYDPAILPGLRALPGARWDRDNRVWRVSTRPQDLLALVAGLNKLGCPVPADLIDGAKGLAAEVAATEAAATTRAADPRLYAYQRDGVRWLAGRCRALLGDEMGLGKTVQVLLAQPENARALVVCPASLKGNWRDECARWRPDLTPAVLSGRDSFRWPAAGELVVTNYDVLADAPAAAPGGVVVVADEVHATKSKAAKRTKRFVALVAAAGAAGGRTWGLTGTPMLNRPPELFQVLDNLGLVPETFGHFGAFYRCFGAKRSDYGTVWGRPTAEVPGRLARAMLRRERTTVLADLPGKTSREVRVNGLPAKLQTMCDAALARWDAARARSGSGLPGFEEMSAVRAALAEYKTPFAVELVEEFEAADEPVVVFSAHRAPVELLAARPGWAAILGGTPNEERTRIVAEFQAGKLKGLAATIKAGGVGLTLTRACQMLFVDLEWTPALNAQAEDRICRIGQRSACCYTHIVAEHDLDARMAEVLGGKASLIAATIQPQAAVEAAPGPDALAVLAAAVVAPATAARSAEEQEAERAATEAADIAAGKLSRCPSCHAARRVFVSHSDKNPGRAFARCPACSDDRGPLFWWTADRGAYSDAAKAQMTAELTALLDCCDGAHERDGAGFAACDVIPSRRLASDIQRGVGIDWDALQKLLVKYRKTQLGGAASPRKEQAA